MSPQNGLKVFLLLCYLLGKMIETKCSNNKIDLKEQGNNQVFLRYGFGHWA